MASYRSSINSTDSSRRGENTGSDMPCCRRVIKPHHTCIILLFREDTTHAMTKHIVIEYYRNRPLKKTKNDFQDQISLNTGQLYCRMLHSAIL